MEFNAHNLRSVAHKAQETLEPAAYPGDTLAILKALEKRALIAAAEGRTSATVSAGSDYGRSTVETVPGFYKRYKATAEELRRILQAKGFEFRSSSHTQQFNGGDEEFLFTVSWDSDQRSAHGKVNTDASQ